MKDPSFRIVVYEAPKRYVRTRYSQASFLLSKAKLVKTYPMDYRFPKKA